MGYSEIINVKNLPSDIFGRVPVSPPQTIFDSKQIADNQPLFWDDKEVSGSGTSSVYNTNQASTTISVSNLTAGKRVRQTFRWFNYQTGKSQLILLTGVLGNPQAGITRRAGQFNDQNGYMMLSTPTSIALGIRSFTSGSAVDTIALQTNWNVDKLDGTGRSGLTLDLTKTNIEGFRYQWLGVGAVIFMLVIDGANIPVHQFNHANLLTVVYTSTPNLPLRYEIENDGTGASASLTHICTSVITEGGRQETGVNKGINRRTNTLITNNDALIYPLIGIRLKPTYFGAFIRYMSHQIICTTTAEYAWDIILKPTIVGTAPTWIPLDNSAIEYCFPTNATTLTGGTNLETGLGSDGNQIKNGVTGINSSDLAIGSDINGVPDEIFLSVQRLTGATETFYGCLTINETI